MKVMVNSSTELIAMARKIVERELERSIRKGQQPSFYECIYDAYIRGLSDASGISSDTLSKAQEWHYVELEGLPDDYDEYWCLCQHDGYTECEKGWYDNGKKSWNLNWKGRDFSGVIAWHKLPLSPDE